MIRNRHLGLMSFAKILSQRLDDGPSGVRAREAMSLALVPLGALGAFAQKPALSLPSHCRSGREDNKASAAPDTIAGMVDRTDTVESDIIAP
jgi:hypothetical protein